MAGEIDIRTLQKKRKKKQKKKRRGYSDYIKTGKLTSKFAKKKFNEDGSAVAKKPRVKKPKKGEMDSSSSESSSSSDSDSSEDDEPRKKFELDPNDSDI